MEQADAKARARLSIAASGVGCENPNRSVCTRALMRAGVTLTAGKDSHQQRCKRITNVRLCLVAVLR